MMMLLGLFPLVPELGLARLEIKAITDGLKWKSQIGLNLNIEDRFSENFVLLGPKKKKTQSLDEVDPELLKTYNKLGIPLEEQKMLSNVAVDAVFDSVSVTDFQRRT